MRICQTCGGHRICKTLPGAPNVPCPDCTFSRYLHFSSEELAVTAAALQSVGTACAAQMCGEIAREQANRNSAGASRRDGFLVSDARSARELFEAGRKIIAESK